MTQKQTDIIKSAITLFGSQGYAAISTAKIAREAGVSEGLIFRHFTSKTGLLNVLVSHGDQQYQNYLDAVADHRDPIALLRDFIKLPISMMDAREDCEYYLAVSKIQLELGINREDMYDEVCDRFSWAVAEVGHGKPKSVIRAILSAHEGAISAIHLGDLDKTHAVIAGLLELVINE